MTVTVSTETFTVSVSELSDRLPEIIERAKTRQPSAGLTFHQLIDRLLELGEPDPDYAEDVRWARDNQAYPRVVGWPS